MLYRSLSDRLRAAHLHSVAAAWDLWQADEANAGRCAEACLEYVLERHGDGRTDNRVRAFLRDARLGRPYGLCNFSPARAGMPPELFDQLKTLSWIRLGQTVVITGATRSGKTHLAAGLAHEAVLQEIRAMFVQTPRLLDQLVNTSDATKRNRYFAKLCKAPLLVLDDLATEHATAERTVWLRRLFDAREQAGVATVVTSITEVSEWDQVFDDASSREGIYGRLLDNGCHRVRLNVHAKGTSRPKVPRAKHATRADKAEKSPIRARR
jgi:DNA replication protein DnaC